MDYVEEDIILSFRGGVEIPMPKSVVLAIPTLANLLADVETSSSVAVPMTHAAFLLYLANKSSSEGQAIALEVASYLDDAWTVDTLSRCQSELALDMGLHCLASKVEEARKKIWTQHRRQYNFNNDYSRVLVSQPSAETHTGQMYDRSAGTVRILWHLVMTKKATVLVEAGQIRPAGLEGSELVVQSKHYFFLLGPKHRIVRSCVLPGRQKVREVTFMDQGMQLALMDGYESYDYDGQRIEHLPRPEDDKSSWRVDSDKYSLPDNDFGRKLAKAALFPHPSGEGYTILHAMPDRREPYSHIVIHDSKFLFAVDNGMLFGPRGMDIIYVDRYKVIVRKDDRILALYYQHSLAVAQTRLLALEDFIILGEAWDLLCSRAGYCVGHKVCTGDLRSIDVTVYDYIADDV